MTKIKKLVWRDSAVPEEATQGLWSVSCSIIGTYEIHIFDNLDGVWLGLPHGIALTQYADVASAMDAADEHFRTKIESVLEKNGDDIVARLERIALMAERACEPKDDIRLMPAAGVADVIYEAMSTIVDLRVDLEIARGDATEAETFAEELLDAEGNQ